MDAGMDEKLARRLGGRLARWICYCSISRGCDALAEKTLANDYRLPAWVLRVWRCTVSRLRGVLRYCCLHKSTHWCPLGNENREDGKLCPAFVPSPASPQVLARGPGVDSRLAPTRAVSGTMHRQGTAFKGAAHGYCVTGCMYRQYSTSDTRIPNS